MGLVIKNAYAAQPGAAATLIYTAPANNQARCLKCTVCNDTTSAITFKAYKVPSGESVGDAYLIYNDKAIGSKETYGCPDIVGQVLDAGDMIYIHPSAADQLSVMFDVMENV